MLYNRGGRALINPSLVFRFHDLPRLEPSRADQGHQSLDLAPTRARRSEGVFTTWYRPQPAFLYRSLWRALNKLSLAKGYWTQTRTQGYVSCR